ncbi:MAG: hypothetical protein OXC30_02425 [Alphaproteobacteria bacterium]|nr:hypothetical protein [Alphaproteobacteria bacterium]
MINVIIFSLFMFILNIDAAEGPALKDFGWSARDCVQAHYDTLKFNLRRTCIELKDEDKDNAFVLQDCYVVLEEFYPVEELISEWRTCNATLPACKVMLPECDMLSPCKVILDACALLCKRFLKEIFSTQLDTSIILYLLRKKSEENAKELAKIFIVEGYKVMKGATVLCDALGRCVPVAQSREDIENALHGSSLDVYSGTMKKMQNNYTENTGSKRFSPSLTCVFSKRYFNSPGDTFSKMLDQDNHYWRAGLSVRKYYQIMQTNLEQYGIRVPDSSMLYICQILSNCFQEESLVMQREIDLILYVLCKKSVKNAEELAQTFRDEDAKVSDQTEMIFDAFGRCVPEVECADIANVLYNFLPRDIQIYKKLFRNFKRRYEKKGSERFLKSLGLPRFLLADAPK